jgi:hypothetical protein
MQRSIKGKKKDRAELKKKKKRKAREPRSLPRGGDGTP